MKIIEFPNRDDWNKILSRPTFERGQLQSTVSDILSNVASKGDEALLSYSEKFDKVKLSSIEVSVEEVDKAKSEVSAELKHAIQIAFDNITVFHKAQKRQTLEIETMPGVNCWRKSVAVQKVGIYIPGGTAPLFSTVLMLGIPANLAGCKDIVLCTPPDKNGNINPAILYAADLVGVTKIIKVGGAQAIAALAFGTETVPKVNKIFGPGNQFVTEAKQQVSLTGTAIDMPAGPSEVEIIADDTAIASFVASDLLSQAEHGKDSQVILVSTSKQLILDINDELDKQLKELSRREMAEASLKNSKSILVKDLDEAIEITNEYAPEHLIISTENAKDLADEVVNAGSVFIGNYTPESAGDYASGTNHTLPTNGAAMAYSGVSLDSFTKQITYQEISKEGLKNIGPSIEVMAAAEELDAHKMAVSIRLLEINKS